MVKSTSSSGFIVDVWSAFMVAYLWGKEFKQQTKSFSVVIGKNPAQNHRQMDNRNRISAQMCRFRKKRLYVWKLNTPGSIRSLIFLMFLLWSSLVVAGHRWAIHQQNNHTCSVTSTVAQTLPKLTAQKWPSESNRLPHTLLRGLDTAEPSAGNDPWLGVRPHHRSHCLSQH